MTTLSVTSGQRKIVTSLVMTDDRGVIDVTSLRDLMTSFGVTVGDSPGPAVTHNTSQLSRAFHHVFDN